MRSARFRVSPSPLNAMILLFTVNVFPFAAFMLFIVDLLVIYGLAVYGGRRQPGASARTERTARC